MTNPIPPKALAGELEEWIDNIGLCDMDTFEVKEFKTELKQLIAAQKAKWIQHGRRAENHYWSEQYVQKAKATDDISEKHRLRRLSKQHHERAQHLTSTDQKEKDRER